MSSSPSEMARESASQQDKELALAFQRGEDGAYQAIYERYSDRVLGVCRRMLRNPDDAQEAAQEAFLRTYQGLSRFNGRYELGAWIARIATNVCLDQWRSQNRRPVDFKGLEALDAEIRTLDDQEGSPESVFQHRADAARVRDVLDKMPTLHRAAIVLRDHEGFSYEEIASTLDISEAQVKALLHRARKRFKRSWLEVVASFIPGRMFQRFKDAPAAGFEHVAQGGVSATQFATSCSTMLQQCGQFMADKIAPALTAGAVALGGVAIASTPDPSVSRPVETRLEVSGIRTGVGTGDAQPQESPKRSAASKRGEDTPVTQPPAEPAPAASPTAPPAEEPQEPAGEVPPAEGAQPAPQASPVASPTAPGLMGAVAFGRGGQVVYAPIGQHRGSVDCSAGSATENFTAPTRDGDASYASALTLSGGSASDFDLTVWPNGESGANVHYSGSGDLTSRASDGDRMTLKYSGTYTNTDAPDAESAGLPSSGGFSLELSLDCRWSSVVAVTLVLS